MTRPSSDLAGHTADALRDRILSCLSFIRGADGLEARAKILDQCDLIEHLTNGLHQKAQPTLATPRVVSGLLAEPVGMGPEHDGQKGVTG